MSKLNQAIEKIDEKIDRIAKKLESKTAKLYIDIIGPIIFIAFAVAVLALMPNQIRSLTTLKINEKTFPTLLMGLILVCAVFLLIKEIINIVKNKKARFIELNLLVEVKALIIFAILVLYRILMGTIGFTISSCILGVLMLVFFRVKKWWYYVIVLVSAVLISVFFQNVVNVRMP